MLKIADLPSVTFVSEGSAADLNFAAEEGRLRWLAARLQREFPDAIRLGIIYPANSDLILVWFAALLAGKEPCLLQYPTAKQSAEYWTGSVTAAIESCALDAIVSTAALPAPLPTLVPTLLLDAPFESTDGEPLEICTGAIIQLSSGTTGHRKGIRFTLRQVERHVRNFNQVLGLTGSDVIVSWLPLYHDMGFIACFLMPLLLKVRIVMMDPVTWVRRPALLFETIARHQGTVCYMPNFGFEVMAKSAADRPALATMRRWVSCSEPTHAQTLQRFCDATGVPSANLAVCYGMAENVFAVTWAEGSRTLREDGTDRLSCGRPIPGTEVVVREGEIHVRSDTSAAGYLGIGDIRGSDGFYPTGDTGYIADGELVVSGRRRDIMISAGKKHLLSDLDYALGSCFPDSAGRIASLAAFDNTLGSETALFLVEDGNFWLRGVDMDLQQKIRAATGLETFQLHFVPPAFITKTSSGKINRAKTAQDWAARVAHEAGESHLPGAKAAEPHSFRERIRSLFPAAAWDLPVRQIFDSLGSVSLRISCEECGIRYDADATLDQLARSDARGQAGPAQKSVFSVVALVDCMKLGFKGGPSFVDAAFIRRLEKLVGCPVRFEQVVAPPAPILFSDLVFHDYFMARDDVAKYSAFSGVIQKLKSASLVLVDDEDAFRMLEVCVYPCLSHRFVNHPSADLLAYRLQPYTHGHHRLAKSIVLGGDIPLEIITPSIDQLASYLRVPTMRLAFHEAYRQYTSSWDYTEYRQYIGDEDYQRNPVNARAIQRAILDFIAARRDQCRLAAVPASPQPLAEGPPHFCSFLLSRKAVDTVVDRFESFCIAGLPCSAPYITQRLEEKGKRYFFSGDLNPARQDYECMLCTGFYGPSNTTRPYLEFMQIGWEGGRVRNASAELIDGCGPLVECNPAELIRFLIGVSRGVMPVGNYILNQARLRQRSAARAA